MYLQEIVYQDKWSTFCQITLVRQTKCWAGEVKLGSHGLTEYPSGIRTLFDQTLLQPFKIFKNNPL